MYKIAITLRKKEDHMTFFMNDTYYQFLSPYFDIELVVPRRIVNIKMLLIEIMRYLFVEGMILTLIIITKNHIIQTL